MDVFAADDLDMASAGVVEVLGHQSCFRPSVGEPTIPNAVSSEVVSAYDRHLVTVVGSFAAWSFSNLAGRFLFGLDPRDGRAYGVAMATLIAAALIATVLPARRAAGIDPTEALRSE